jgi:hypothetical protein
LYKNGRKGAELQESMFSYSGLFALSSRLFLLRDRLIDSEINKLLHGYANRSRPRQSSAHLLSLKVHFSPKYIFS